MTSEDIKTAVNEAVDICIRDGILAVFFRKHKTEVTDVGGLTEYDKEKHMKLVAREAMAEGIEIGIAKAEKRAEIKGAIKYIRWDMNLSDKDIVSLLMKVFSISEDEAWENVRMYK